MVTSSNWNGGIFPNFLEQVKKCKHHWLSIFNLDHNDRSHLKFRLLSIPIIVANKSSNDSSIRFCEKLLLDDDGMLERWLLLWYGCVDNRNQAVYYVLVFGIYSVLFAWSLLVWSNSSRVRSQEEPIISNIRPYQPFQKETNSSNQHIWRSSTQRLH